MLNVEVSWLSHQGDDVEAEGEGELEILHVGVSSYHQPANLLWSHCLFWGGEIGVAVGSHIKELSKNKQILCITHLASIAVYADNQLKVSKGLDAEAVRTAVVPVTGESRIAEIARMLSGDSESMESREHARSLLAKFC